MGVHRPRFPSGEALIVIFLVFGMLFAHWQGTYLQ